MPDDASVNRVPEDAAPRIRLGWRLRLGVLQPSVNVVAEPTFQAMLPEGVSIHATRLKLVGSSEEELMAMTDGIEEASRLLADCLPHRILFHCTAVTVHDTGIVERIKARITQSTGVPATVTSEGLIAAFRKLGARRIVMVTPYIREVNEREVAFLTHHGLEVLSEHGLGLPGGKEFLTVEPSTWYRLVMERRDPRADAYFISCAQSRCGEIIASLERDLGRPVVTSNQAAMWHCLRESGINDRVAGFGSLLCQ